jgi:hypothetical protein
LTLRTRVLKRGVILGPRGLLCNLGEGRLVWHGPDLGPCPNGTTLIKGRDFIRRKRFRD